MVDEWRGAWKEVGVFRVISGDRSVILDPIDGAKSKTLEIS